MPWRITTTLQGLIALSIISLLTACTFGPSTPTPVQQCIGIQREILFAENFTPDNTNPLQTQASQDQLQRQYQEMRCYQLLQKAKENNPKK